MSMISRRSILKSTAAALATCGLPVKAMADPSELPITPSKPATPGTLAREFYQILKNDRELMAILPGGLWRKVIPRDRPRGRANPSALYYVRDKPYGMFRMTGATARFFGPRLDELERCRVRASRIISDRTIDFDKGTAKFGDVMNWEFGSDSGSPIATPSHGGVLVYEIAACWRFSVEA